MNHGKRNYLTILSYHTYRMRFNNHDANGEGHESEQPSIEMEAGKHP